MSDDTVTVEIWGSATAEVEIDADDWTEMNADEREAWVQRQFRSMATPAGHPDGYDAQGGDDA